MRLLHFKTNEANEMKLNKFRHWTDENRDKLFNTLKEQLRVEELHRRENGIIAIGLENSIDELICSYTDRMYDNINREIKVQTLY